MEDRRYEFSYHRQAASWTQVGDRVFGDFFRITGQERVLGTFDGRTALWKQNLRGSEPSPHSFTDCFSQLRRRAPQLMSAG